MGFTEEAFLFIFLPVTLLLYLGISKLRMPKLNNIILVVFSLLFYAWADINTLEFMLYSVFLWVHY
jgi:alginate O-acetyltransferase complex protein AlgI